MKRAEVFQAMPGTWQVFIWDGRIPDRGESIPLREGLGREPLGTRICCTYAEALAHALAEVGLTEKNTETRRSDEHR